jgi:hypothetical protein
MITNINLDLTERDGKAVVSSRDIARVFEKEHRAVVDNSPVWGLRNFARSSCANEQNKPRAAACRRFPRLKAAQYCFASFLFFAAPYNITRS